MVASSSHCVWAKVDKASSKAEVACPPEASGKATKVSTRPALRNCRCIAAPSGTPPGAQASATSGTLQAEPPRTDNG